MKQIVLVTGILCAASTAHADSNAETTERIAVAVNSPISWAGSTFGASGYVGLTEHQALRANFASANGTPLAFGIVAAFAADDGSTDSERTTDVGIGWMYFPRRLWSGATFELGVLGRGTHTKIAEDPDEFSILTTATKTIAGRALVGWSWSWKSAFLSGWSSSDHTVFLSVAAGASAGYESGTKTETYSPDFPDPPMKVHVHGFSTAFECFMRIGFAFSG
jgi:hypothetical protein